MADAMKDKRSCASLLNGVLGLTAFAVIGLGAVNNVPIDAPEFGHWADPVGVMVDQHHCWTGEAPKDMVGKLPGHVVVTYVSNGMSRRPVYSKALVGKALGVALEGKHAKFQVAAFCR